MYRAQVCWLPRPLSDADVALLAGTRELEVQQDTPVRVRPGSRACWILRKPQTATISHMCNPAGCCSLCSSFSPPRQVLHRRANLCRPKVSWQAVIRHGRRSRADAEPWQAVRNSHAAMPPCNAHALPDGATLIPAASASQVIHELRAEELPGQLPGYFALHLRTQAGTYIKEFVHGGSGWMLAAAAAAAAACPCCVLMPAAGGCTMERCGMRDRSALRSMA